MVEPVQQVAPGSGERQRRREAPFLWPMIASRDHRPAITGADQERTKTSCFPYDPPNKDLEQTHPEQNKERKKRTTKANTRKRDPLFLDLVENSAKRRVYSEECQE
jgi:hypothetical protein